MLRIALLAGGLAGCSVSAAVQASADFGCAEEAIQVDELNTYVQKAQGCGRTDIYGYSEPQGRWYSVRERASFELGCERDKLEVTQVGPNQAGVTGCNTRRVYVFTDSGWVLDSSGEAPAPTGPPPP
jgi:hypothetical protein